MYLGATALMLFTCDHFLGQKSLQPGQRLIDLGAVERDWHDNLDAFGLRSKVRLLRMKSTDCYEILRAAEERFGLVFIDGGHDDEAVRADTRFAELLLPSGVIAFHDYHSATFPGIKSIVDECFAEPVVPLIKMGAVGSIGAFQRLKVRGPSLVASAVRSNG